MSNQLKTVKHFAVHVIELIIVIVIVIEIITYLYRAKKTGTLKICRMLVSHNFSIRSQSYDFGIYNYIHRQRSSRLERFLKTEENIFVFKTH
jgi:hypothetical protein